MTLSQLPATEMQARLTAVLYANPPTITCVTHHHVPVIAVIPWSLYHARTPGGPEQVPIHLETISVTEARQLFLSYTHRLAPRLAPNKEGGVTALQITRRKKPVGIIFAWDTWIKLSSGSDTPTIPEDAEHTISDSIISASRTMTISTVRHSLFALAEQFAIEAEQQRYQPVIVENHQEPVFAIVPWQWYLYITNALKLPPRKGTKPT